MRKISLKAARVDANLTLAEVVKKVKIGKNTLINYEKGRTYPDIETAKRLASLYDRPIDDIKFF